MGCLIRRLARQLCAGAQATGRQIITDHCIGRYNFIVADNRQAGDRDIAGIQNSICINNRLIIAVKFGLVSLFAHADARFTFRSCARDRVAVCHRVRIGGRRLRCGGGCVRNLAVVHIVLGDGIDKFTGRRVSRLWRKNTDITFLTREQDIRHHS